MRSVFDQYTQPENRLTHALMCSLARDRKLLVDFLRWVGVEDCPKPDSLRIVEQQVPGVYESGDDEDEQRGLPDGCIFADDDAAGGWALLIEAKVQARASVEQLRRHLNTAAKCGFENARVLLLSVDDPPADMPDRAMWRSWRAVYGWAKEQGRTRSEWAAELAGYMEDFEARMVAQNYSVRGTLTMFKGLHFDDDDPYTYREGKRLIGLLGDELQDRKDLRKIGVDPKGARRGAITGTRGSGVWDFLPLKAARGAKNFTAYPHLTMSIREDTAGAAITVPNGVRGGFRRKIRALELDGFIELLQEIEHRTRPVCKKSRGSVAKVYVEQKHFASQRSKPKMDARLFADLQTVVSGKRKGTKYQPQWVEGVYALLAEKKSNLQFGVGMSFEYGCPILGSEEAVDLFADAWIAMSPLLEFVLDE